MFDVGISKLLIILAVALIVLGPEKLPAVAGQIGRWLGRARTMARQFRDQLEEEASSLQNVKRSFNAALDPTSVPAATAAAANLTQPVAGASLDAASQTAEGHSAGASPGSGAMSEADLPQPVFRPAVTEPTPNLTTATAPPLAAAPAAAVTPPAAAPAVAPPAALRAPAFAATPDYASAAVTLDVSADERGS